MEKKSAFKLYQSDLVSLEISLNYHLGTCMRSRFLYQFLWHNSWLLYYAPMRTNIHLLKMSFKLRKTSYMWEKSILHWYPIYVIQAAWREKSDFILISYLSNTSYKREKRTL